MSDALSTGGLRAGTTAVLSYLAPTSRVNRRYVAPGAEMNTGTYEEHRVFVRNGRTATREFSLDENGFVFARHVSAVADFTDRAQVETLYTGEVQALVRDLTGADLVVPLGWMIRRAGEPGPSAQPPAADVHVDMTEASARRRAAALFKQAAPGHEGFRRFIATSLWRTFSEPPQDWPLAVCDASSVADSEGVPNVMLVVDSLPQSEAIPAELPGAENLPAAFVFHFNAQHRWWYFPCMTRDEVILLKLHDSDHSVAWRVPHTAFQDSSFANARRRESIEFRTIAYFL